MSDSRALKWGESPIKPIWVNWKDVIKHYPDIHKIRDTKIENSHPTKKNIGKRSHSSTAQTDELENEASKSSISGHTLVSCSSGKMTRKASPKSRDTSEAPSMGTQTDIVIGKDEIKGISLDILHAGNTPKMKADILDSMEPSMRVKRMQHMLNLSKKRREKDKKKTKEIELRNVAYVQKMDERLKEIKEEQTAKRNAQMKYRIEK